MWCKTILLSGVLAAALAVSSSVAQPGPPNQPSGGFPAADVNVPAQDFVARAANSDMYEIRSAELARRMSGNPQIDAFAARMIADHSKSSRELGDIVARRGRLVLPTQLDDRHRGLLEQLHMAGRRQFPALYMQQQVQAHEDAVALFSSYSRNGDHPRIRRFAEMTLPTIRGHLDMARSLSFQVQHGQR